MAVVTSGLVAEYVGKLAKTGTLPGNNVDPTWTWDDLIGTNNGTVGVGAYDFAWTSTSGWAGAGTSGNAYRLSPNDINDRVIFSSPLISDGHAVYSLEVWTESVYSSGARSCLSNAHSTQANQGVNLIISATGVWSLEIWNDANSEFTISANGAATQGAMTHVVGTFDDTTARLYIDGSAQTATSTPTGAITLNLSAFFASCFGGLQDAYWLGDLATARIYNRALSVAEVSQNYAAGVLAASTDAPVFTGSGALTTGAAIIAAGTGTHPAGPPTLTTVAISAITSSTATSGGVITSSGGSAITAKGVCWNKTGTPTIADSHTTD